MNICVIWNSLGFLYMRKRRDRKCYYYGFSWHWVPLLSSITIPHDGNYIHSIFFSHKTWLQDVINVSSPIQNQLTKNLKNHLHENLIPFSTQNMGLWYRELKGIFMHGRSDWVDVKIAASCVFYLGGPNSAITRYRIYWDFWG